MNKDNILQSLHKLNVFESQTGMTTMIEIFGQPRGRQLWNEYKGKCNYSPLRLSRIITDKEKEMLAEYLTKI